MRHLADDRLAALAAGRTREGEEHLASCARCRERRDVWARRLEALARLGRERVREDELHRLRTLFAVLGPGAGRRTARLVRTAGAPALAGVRGAGPELLTFAADPLRVLLEVRPEAGGRWSVHGRVTGVVRPSGGRAAAVSERGAAIVAGVDEEGEFHLGALPPGTYRLVVAAGGERVVVEGLAVGGEG